MNNGLSEQLGKFVNRNKSIENASNQSFVKEIKKLGTKEQIENVIKNAMNHIKHPNISSSEQEIAAFFGLNNANEDNGSKSGFFDSGPKKSGWNGIFEGDGTTMVKGQRDFGKSRR